MGAYTVSPRVANIAGTGVWASSVLWNTLVILEIKLIDCLLWRAMRAESFGA